MPPEFASIHDLFLEQILPKNLYTKKQKIYKELYGNLKMCLDETKALKIKHLDYKLCEPNDGTSKKR